MRNKKGFTLTEVLVTIAIIGIVLLIAVPSIMVINRSVKKRELETKKEVLISAAGATSCSDCTGNTYTSVIRQLTLVSVLVKMDQKQ